MRWRSNNFHVLNKEYAASKCREIHLILYKGIGLGYFRKEWAVNSSKHNLSLQKKQ